MPPCSRATRVSAAAPRWRAPLVARCARWQIGRRRAAGRPIKSTRLPAASTTGLREDSSVWGPLERLLAPVVGHFRKRWACRSYDAQRGGIPHPRGCARLLGPSYAGTVCASALFRRVRDFLEAQAIQKGLELRLDLCGLANAFIGESLGEAHRCHRSLIIVPTRHKLLQRVRAGCWSHHGAIGKVPEQERLMAWLLPNRDKPFGLKQLPSPQVALGNVAKFVGIEQHRAYLVMSDDVRNSPLL